MHNQVDKILLGITLALVMFGLVMIASASVVYAEARFGDAYFFFKRQVLGVALGLVALYLFSRIDYHVFRKWAFVFFVGAIVLLILVLIPGVGTEAYGANRWLQLGPVSFQPSEAVKLALIFYLAAWFASRGKKAIRQTSEGFVWFLMVLGVIGFLMIKQPDVGTLGMITLIAIAMFFLAGARLSHIMIMFLGGVALLTIIIKAAPYRLNRFLVFLNPELDPQGIGYQINQALLAIGSGGILGLGLGHSRQKHLYLPEPAGDSIFAIIGEELGLIGAMVVIILFILFLLRGLKISQNAPDIFGRLVAGGIVVWIVFQALLNIAAITALIPLTGIPLPFISYGGTSVVFLLAAVGILLNIAKQSRL